MGSGDTDELVPSDAELAAAEAQTLQLLGRWGEPAPAPPPPALASRVMASLPGAPARRRRPSRRPLAGLLAALILLPLLVVGLWGALGDPRQPAAIFGGPESLLGRLVLAATLAAKPLVNLVAGSGMIGLVALLALLGGTWLWWRLVEVGPALEVA